MYVNLLVMYCTLQHEHSYKLYVLTSFEKQVVIRLKQKDLNTFPKRQDEENRKSMDTNEITGYKVKET